MAGGSDVTIYGQMLWDQQNPKEPHPSVWLFIFYKVVCVSECVLCV